MKPQRVKQLRGRIVGLAISERSLFAAEVRASGQSVEARELAEFVYPPGLSLDAPEALGKALGQFLRERNFHSHAAILGLPAKWLMVRNKQVPPADEATVADLLRMQNEQEFSAEMDLVFDYASNRGTSAAGSSAASIGASAGATATAVKTPAQGKSVLLVATPRKHVEAAIKLAEAADLNVQAVTSSSAALALATLSRQSDEQAPQANSRLVLYLDRSAAELTLQRGSALEMLKHLRFERGGGAAQPSPEAPASPSWFAPPSNGSPAPDGFGSFVGDLRRAVALLPREEEGAQQRLALWDSSGLSDDELQKVQEAVGFPVRGQSLESIGVAAANGALAPQAAADASGARYGAAVALALCGLEGELPIDFLHSRLVVAKKSRFGPAAIWGAAAALAILVLVVAAYLYTNALSSDAEDARQALVTMQPTVKSAQQLKDEVDHAANWFGGRTPITSCFAEITRLFPDSEQSWATRFEMQRSSDSEAFNCTVAGKTSRDAPLALPDSMSRDTRFSQVYMLLNEISAVNTGGQQGFSMGRGEPQENFVLNFVYQEAAQAGKKPAAPSASTVSGASPAAARGPAHSVSQRTSK